MSRKRKSADILSQLGEPLPLPYQADTRVKKEDSSRVSSADYKFYGAEPLRDEPPAMMPDDIPLPIWRKREISGYKAHENGQPEGRKRRELYKGQSGRESRARPQELRGNEHDEVQGYYNDGYASEVHENTPEHERVIQSLQQKLDDLRKEYERHRDSPTVSRSNLKTLHKIGDKLDELMEESQQKHIFNEQQHIIQELEKYQRSGTGTRLFGTSWYPLAFISLFLLSLSYLAGHFAYDYCYYIC